MLEKPTRAREPHQGENESRGPSGNHPTYPPPPIETEADQPAPPPTNPTRAGAYRTERTEGPSGTQYQREETFAQRP